MTPAIPWFRALLFAALCPLGTFAFQQAPSPHALSPPTSSLQLPSPRSLSPLPNPGVRVSSEKALEEALKKQRASLETQRQAISLQLAAKREQPEPFLYRAGEFIVPFPALSQPGCPPLDRNTVGELVSVAAQEQSLDPALLRAVIKRESGFNPCAVSIKGAQGLMQLMPGTARDLHVGDVFDPAQNVHAGAAYLKQLLDRYKGDLRLALVGYNAGPGRADQTAGTPYPLETQNYVASILADLGIDAPATASVKEDLAPPDEVEEQTQASAAPAQAATGTPPAALAISAERTKSPGSKP